MSKDNARAPWVYYCGGAKPEPREPVRGAKDNANDGEPANGINYFEIPSSHLPPAPSHPFLSDSAPQTTTLVSQPPTITRGVQHRPGS